MTLGRAAAVVATGAVLLLAVPASPAAAHPLGNFTVNHADHLLLASDGVQLTAVVDRAEIPTVQTLQQIAPDGTPDADQLALAAADQCADLAGNLRLTVDGAPVAWSIRTTALETMPGAANLPTLRLTCDLRAEADLSGPATVAFTDDHLVGPVGWREITADGDGVRLLDSAVPAESTTDQLRSYPEDLLSSPVDARSFAVDTVPGETTGNGGTVAPRSGDPFGSAMAALDRRLQKMIGNGALTPLVGGLALALAVLLGCGHALLPGHGKTVMAAYLAGRAGRPRDAVTVGATVTVTHTVGVLLLGAALSLSSALAGDQVLRWLGVISGLLVAVIGGFMLRGALRSRTRGAAPADQLPEPALAVGVSASSGADRGTSVGVRDGHGHDHHDHHGDGHDHEHDHGHGHGDGLDGWWSGGHTHGPGGHTHGPGRGGLVGMGIAGGLVPSPSALIVLLASIGLGRTVFGVLLVIAYGLGMAATLTTVGLALVGLRQRLDHRLATRRASGLLGRGARSAPVVTASFVLLVGLALMARGVVLGA